MGSFANGIDGILGSVVAVVLWVRKGSKVLTFARVARGKGFDPEINAMRARLDELQKKLC